MNMREDTPLRSPWVAPVAVIASTLVALLIGQKVSLGATTTLSVSGTYVVAVLATGQAPGRGELIAFRPGPGARYHRGKLFVKRLAGLPGDRIERLHTPASEMVAVNGQPLAPLKPLTRDGRALPRGPTGVLPACHYFVYGDHRDSYDSRYADIGWVRCEQVVGRAIRLL